ncbi:MAG: DUF3501 family protein [Pseudomonadota bacterium]|nr:DUF3501 family protein [Pseudomonadota bacterium]
MTKPTALLTAEDILPNAVFLERRPRLEREVIRNKEARRVALGPNLTFLFENKVTLGWQIQEMCRVEQISAPEAVKHELDTYNALLPGPNELTATLLVEYEEAGERDRMLAKLLGLQNHVRLEIEGQEPVQAAFDAEQYNMKRISSVQFVRFALLPGQVDALCDLRRRATLVCDHSAYAARCELTGAARGALVEDLLAGR